MRHPLIALALFYATASAISAQTADFKPTPSEGDRNLTLVTTAPMVGAPVQFFILADADQCNAAGVAGKTALALGPAVSNVMQAIPTAPNATSFTLADALVAGNKLCGVLTPAGSAAPAFTPATTVQQPAAPPGFDWGLVRAYFTLGALTSQERDQFSHQDLFLAFHLDKTYTMLGNNSAAGGHSFHPGLNSFFETRLTAIPVAVQSCPAATTTSGSTSTTTTTGSSCANSNSSSSSSTSTTTSTQAFLNTQKTARLIFGLYTPFMLDRWSVATKAGKTPTSTDYALFIAPLIKTGYDTTINGLNQTQQQSSTPDKVQSIGNSTQFYKFYDFGFRLGHYELSGSKSKAPSLLSYLDVGFGRFSNLSSILCPQNLYVAPNTCNSTNTTGSVTTSAPLPYQRDWRINVEGLLEIPAARGFSVGFSTNVGLHNQGKASSISLVHIVPGDDLRFLFAYKFDISKIAAKLAPSLSN